MTQYDIARWDAVMYKNSLTQVPMIYFKPDIELLEYFTKNNYAVAVQITGSESMYDGKVIPCVVDRSCNVPSCRPNFCEATGYYVASLWSNWYGYPKKLGKVSFIGLEPSEKKNEKNTAENTVNYGTKSYDNLGNMVSRNPPNSMSGTQIGVIFGSLFVLVLIVLMISLFTSNHK